VPRRELRPESRKEKALDSIKVRLGCGRYNGYAEDVCLPLPASKAVPRNLMLWACASRSHALVPALAALMNPCAHPVGMYRDNM
jgi:hypothetical protein